MQFEVIALTLVITYCTTFSLLQLREACCARGISVGEADYADADYDLQDSLAEWLELSQGPPPPVAAVYSSSRHSKDSSSSSTSSSSSSNSSKASKVFVPERACIALLGLNVLAGVRSAQESEMPLLLLSGPQL
jgi:hypothetical protein